MGIQDPSPRSTIGVGKYKTWTPGPWTPSADRVHGPGSSKYGPGPWTPFHGPGPWTPLSWTGSMDPLFLQVEVAPDTMI